jgi:hypothetical protein
MVCEDNFQRKGERRNGRRQARKKQIRKKDGMVCDDDVVELELVLPYDGSHFYKSGKDVQACF